ncbi:MAG: hypothetical protein ACP5PQ_04030 [Thermoproteota archaeon]
MFRWIVKIVKIVIILVAAALFKNLIDLVWRVSTGLDSNGLSSLITLVIIAFSFTLLLPLGNPGRKRVRRFFKEAFVFLFIWTAASFSIALLHQPKHALIGFIPTFLYFSFRRGLVPNIGFRIICENPVEEVKAHVLLLSVAPTPRVAFLHRFNPTGLLKVLKKEARIRLKQPENVFIKSFKHRQTIELNGSLSSFVSRVEASLTHETAILCEASPYKGFFKIKVKIASDNSQVLRNIVEKLSKLDSNYDENVEIALEKWCALNPCVKTVSNTLGETQLKPSWITGRLLIAGDQEKAEKLTLQICLSQLRRNTMIIIWCSEEELDRKSFFQNMIGETLREKGFRFYEKPIETWRNHDGMEIVLANSVSDNTLIKKASSKPVVAVWLKNSIRDFEFDAPVKILTSQEPYPHPGFEADNVMLMECSRRLAEWFLPAGHEIALEGRTVMVSAGEVRVLK